MACKFIGYLRAYKTYMRSPLPSNTTFSYNILMCKGTEQNLNNCRQITNGGDCKSKTAVGVLCTNDPLVPATGKTNKAKFNMCTYLQFRFCRTMMIFESFLKQAVLCCDSNRNCLELKKSNQQIKLNLPKSLIQAVKHYQSYFKEV